MKRTIIQASAEGYDNVVNILSKAKVANIRQWKRGVAIKAHSSSQYTICIVEGVVHCRSRSWSKRTHVLPDEIKVSCHVMFKTTDVLILKCTLERIFDRRGTKVKFCIMDVYIFIVLQGQFFHIVCY